MTSIVKHAAHPADGKEMVVRVFRHIDNGEGVEDIQVIEEKVLQKGETFEAVIYDDRRVVSFERDKA